ncbi:MAG: hypothetical protein AB7O66_04010 [Limisphaerales bacterium]
MNAESQPESGGPAEPGFKPPTAPPAWAPVVLGAAAGGLGWGIRGQYGHETGAMIAGLLVSLTWVLLLFRHAPGPIAIRAVAWATVAMGWGGAMTYGQTVGLTHDQALVGHVDALRWGLLGLAIKGSVWIGFAGLFLGMAVGGVRYRPLELAGLFAGMLVLAYIGIRLLNEPFDPARRLLPRVYFSADWRWNPDADLKPRREIWGGLLFALVGAILHTALARRDRIAVRLAGWGMLGGALGFPAGQSLQAFHAWHLPWFRSGALAGIDPLINWWNFMETTFGAVFGAVLGFGVWRCLRSPASTARFRETGSHHGDPFPHSAPPQRPPWLDVGLFLVGVHTVLLLAAELGSNPVLERYTDLPLVMGILPVIAAALSFRAAWLVALPVTVLPIALKTVRRLVQEDPTVAPALGWFVYGILPVGIALALAVRFASTTRSAGTLTGTLRASLAFATATFFALNFAFFRYPWPWEAWTTRTPNAVVFTVCATALLVLAWKAGRGRAAPGQ